ncbi:S-layer homology domain-containing protein [Nitriliruptor alkaliphilus]|uniref:S-layer homology domain-containing protein n=1 Tax=Nitriliruptor alkaliphilus TaxID=427918 RepID=UPI0012ECC136|nr:S-layer homology domain-containing protein [Nitriliruptor alkaliphilus]
MHLLTRSRRGGAGRRLATRGPLAALLAVGLIAPVATASAAADVPTGDPMPAAAGWVARQLDATSSPSAVQLADAILAFAASGSARDAGDAALTKLTALGSGALSTPGDAAKTLLALHAQGAGGSPLATDAEAALRDAVDGDGKIPFGADQTQLFVQSLAILALETTAGGAPEATVDFLEAEVCGDDGSYRVAGGCPGGDVDTTAVAAQALIATERGAADQITFLLGAQNADGSFGPAGDENTNSTALAAQALRYAGEDDAADDALDWVLGQQRGCEAKAADRGSFTTYTDAPGNVRIATTQAVFAGSAALHELDASTSASATAYLNCTDAFCPPGAGVSVVVDFTALLPNSAPTVACAPRISSGMNGFDVLEAAGFDITTFEFAFGEAICAIEGRPKLADGECFHSSGGFWSYWTAERGGAWDEYQVGAADSTPQVGSIEGWAWAPSWPGDAPRVSTTPLPDAPLPAPPFDRGIADACPGSYPRTFTDIAGSVHEGAIRCLAAAEITRGTSDPSKYAPRDDVKRGQLASLLARSYEQATGEALPAGRARFSDVAGSVHERNINALAAAGVIKGVGDGTRFAPNDTVTRAQMASLLARFVDLLDDDRVNGSFPPATNRDVFGDDDGSVHEPAINRLAVQGVVQGRRDGSYGPNADVTRDQVATFLARSLDLAVDAAIAYPVR